MKLEIRKHDPVVWDDWLWYYYDVPALDKVVKLYEFFDLLAETCRIDLETTLAGGINHEA